ncbi:hypothetical protein [Microbacterium gilvum]|uniref:Uncharacterized protein n=1 Tax=Microbacterium gilvum TaxID=1336204 RepID=A0ABP8ZRP6_9MICO
MSDHDEDPVDRLRAADPAADVEPREGFGADVIAAATAMPVDLDAERARRRPRRGLVIASIAASIAAAVVIGGVAGYGIATAAQTTASADSPSDGGASGGAAPDGVLPPVTLGGGAGGSTEGGGAGSSADSAQSTDRSMVPWGWTGRNAFHASTILSTGAGSAAAYGFDAVSASNAETIEALAAALGVAGTPEIRDGSWQVGAADGTGPSLWVSLDGQLSAGYYSTLDPWSACGEACTAPEEAPAIAALRDLLTRIGADADAFAYSSETWEGSATRTAYASRTIDGQQVGQSWSLEFAADGIVSVYGGLADVVQMGDYPVVSEQEAFDRLSDPRFGAQLTTLPLAAREGDVGTEWTPPTEPPALPAPGSAVSWGVNDVEIVSVRLGLASQWQDDGSVLLVPTYVFGDAGGGEWSVIAVAEGSLDFSAGGEMVFGGAEVLY